MTPKHERKQVWDFLFDFNFKKITMEKAQENLSLHSFRNYKENREMHDLLASVSLELDFNASKFAKDLIAEYQWIKEIEVRAR